MDCANAVGDALGASAPRWAALSQLLDEMHGTPVVEEVDGAAAQHRSHFRRARAAAP
jgi:hypothetical protein